MTDDITDTSTRPIPIRHVITCWCGRSWRVDGESSFACRCGMRFWDIRTKPTFMFNIDESWRV